MSITGNGERERDAPHDRQEIYNKRLTSHSTLIRLLRFFCFSIRDKISTKTGDENRWIEQPSLFADLNINLTDHTAVSLSTDRCVIDCVSLGDHVSFVG